MLAFIKGLSGFLGSLPEIVKLLTLAWNALSEAVEDWRDAKKVKAVREAIQKSRTGDTSRIEAVFNPSRSYHSGRFRTPRWHELKQKHQREKADK